MSENASRDKMLTGVAIGLSLAGLFFLLRDVFKTRGGDKPIIVTSGTLNFWSLSNKLLYGGPQKDTGQPLSVLPFEHRYVHDNPNAVMSTLLVKFSDGTSVPIDDFDKVEIWYNTDSADPTVTMVRGEILIRTNSEHEPLQYDKVQEVEDPEDDKSKKVEAHHHKMGRDGDRIHKIAVCKSTFCRELKSGAAYPTAIKIKYA